MTCVREQVNVRTNSGSSRLRTTSGALVETLVVGHDPENRFVLSKHARAPSRPGTNGGAQTERIMRFASGIFGVSLASGIFGVSLQFFSVG